MGYSIDIKTVVIADYMVVACCKPVCAHITLARRSNLEWMTDDVLTIRWDLLEGFDGKKVRNLCAIDRVHD